MRRLNRRQWIWLFSSALSLSGALFFLAVILIDREYQRIPSGHQIGNRPALVEQLKEKGFPFSFLVISDTHDDENGYTLLEEILKNNHSSFLIHLGDSVDTPNLWRHRYFLKRLAEEIRPPFPIFRVPGNHDIDYGFQRMPEGQKVTPEVYQSLFGAMSFDFTFNNCLFILCAVDLKNPGTFVDDLHSVLSRKAAGKKYIFLFLHYPPEAVISGFDFPREQEFLSLLESYKVTSCFFGHYHGYLRSQVRGTNMIVLGGGGGPLKSWQSEWGKFHHALEVTVGEDSLTENMMVLKRETLFRRSLKWMILVGVLPLIQNRVWMVYAFVLVFIFCLIGSLIALKKAGRRQKTQKWV